MYAGVLSEESGRKLIACLSKKMASKAASKATNDSQQACLIPIVLDVTKQDDVDRAVRCNILFFFLFFFVFLV